MSCAHAVDFFAAYQAMLSVNQQTIAGAQQSAAKPALFTNPKTGSISCPKIGRAARGLLSICAIAHFELWDRSLFHYCAMRFILHRENRAS